MRLQQSSWHEKAGFFVQGGIGGKQAGAEMAGKSDIQAVVKRVISMKSIGKPFKSYGGVKNMNHREARSCRRRRKESNPAEGRPNFARKASIPIDALFMAILSFSRAFSRFSIRFFSFIVIISSIQRETRVVNGGQKAAGALLC